MKTLPRFLRIATVMLVSCSGLASAQCMPCGGCSDPHGNAPTVVSSGCGGAIGCGQGYVIASAASYSEPVVSYGNSDTQAVSVNSMPASETLCEPMMSYRVVMKPIYVTESQAVCVQETRSETRYRTKTVYKTVPIVEENYRTKMVNVPKTETKTVTYTVLVPVKSEKSVEITETVPQWNEVPENYTVRVPTLVDVPEEYNVKVPQLRDETFTYTVNVPQVITEEKTRTVTNAVPVTKRRTISIRVPKTEMKTVTKDYGHWEEQVVDYVDETRTRMRKQVQYNDETRTRMRKTLTYNTITKTQTIPYVTYTTEERTKEVSYTYNVPEYSVEPYQTTRYEQVAEEEIEEYTVSVPYTVTKEQTVQVCKMVPTLVEETISPCTSSNVSIEMTHGESINVGPSVIEGGCGSANGCGAPVMMTAPAVGSGGCGATVSASPCIGC